MDESYPTQEFEKKCIVIKNSDFLAPNKVVIPMKHQKYVSQVVLSRGLILDRIEALAYEIANDYKDKEVFLLIVMKGAVLFGTYLQEKIYEQSKKDDGNHIHVYLDYIQLVSYHNDKSTGSVKILDADTLIKMKGKNIIVVEDIYDSGFCMDQFLKHLKTFEPGEIKTCVLLQKMNPKNLDYKLQIDYLGFLVPNLFVIGFGNDYNEEFRDLNHLCIINKEGIEKFKA
jgi:hypoxanthine phosphoribosyltransferase